MARNKINTNIINDIADKDTVRELAKLYQNLRAEFKYKGYYSIANSVLVKITPDIPSVFTTRSYTFEVLAVSKRLPNSTLTVGTYEVVDAVTIEQQLESLQKLLGLVQIEEEQVAMLKLLYSAQSTESTVEATIPENDTTVSGSDEGGNDAN